MVEKLPSTGEPATPENDHTGCDTSSIRLIHGTLRHLYRGTARLVGSTNEGDAQRVRAVGDRLSVASAVLHDHHDAEDRGWWDTISARTPSCALHVSAMKAQHAQIAALLERQREVLPRWLSEPTEENAAPLAAVLAEIEESLGSHLGQEEDTIVPVIARTWTQQEWDAVAQGAGRKMRKELSVGQQMLVIGYLLDSQPEQTRESIKRTLIPAAVRLMWALFGERRFVGHKSALEARAV